MSRGIRSEHDPARQPRRPWATMDSEDRARLYGYVSGGNPTPHHDMLISSYDIPDEWLDQISNIQVTGGTPEDRASFMSNRLQRIDSIKRRQNRV